ncbi:MAG: hypothetical protein ACRCZ9_02955 [Fusobacteriaceae bacterium]
MDNYILLEKIIFEKGLRYSDVYSMAERHYSVKLSSSEKVSSVSGTVKVLESKMGTRKTYEFLEFVVNQ